MASIAKKTSQRIQAGSDSFKPQPMYPEVANASQEVIDRMEALKKRPPLTPEKMREQWKAQEDFAANYKGNPDIWESDIIK